MRQTEVATSHALGDTGTSTGERQGPYAIWAKHDVWVSFTKVDVCLEDIFSFGVITSRYVPIWKDFECGHFDFDFQFLGQEFADGRANRARTLENDESSRLGYTKVDDLS